MCGILAFYNIAFQENALMKAFSFLSNRGPDEEGCLQDENISLFHKRLAIIDLHSGKEPIFNEDKTIALVFNGEIYNYKKTRRNLESKSHKFSINTDCEVIVHLSEDYEPDKYINMLNGDFAFAVYDRKINTFTIVRDRFGIRPMYYSKPGNGYIFSSRFLGIMDKAFLTEGDFASRETGFWYSGGQVV